MVTVALLLQPSGFFSVLIIPWSKFYFMCILTEVVYSILNCIHYRLLMLSTLHKHWKLAECEAFAESVCQQRKSAFCAVYSIFLVFLLLQEKDHMQQSSVF